ncbi:MAG: hypothetical protein COA42_05670 [Alteromonadaceae bacterium]|nr:MAG: hypothetical protein COA42_05670 [Alteromonadaceae bacterium]
MFSPLDARANVVQDKLNAKCSDVDFVVFGRFKDFEAQMKAQPPYGILALQPIVEKKSDFKPIFLGVKGGETVETYVLVSVDTPVDIKKLDGSKVGAFDLLGRKEMKEFISSQLNAEVNVRRVTKNEDLLPLLSFNSVESIFLPSSLFDKMKATTNLNLVSTPLENKIGLISAALSDASPSESLKSCISEFSNEINNMLGVEKWKEL